MTLYLIFACVFLVSAHSKMDEGLMEFGANHSVINNALRDIVFGVSDIQTAVLKIITPKLTELKREKESNDQLLSALLDIQANITLSEKILDHKMVIFKQKESSITDKLKEIAVRETLLHEWQISTKLKEDQVTADRKEIRKWEDRWSLLEAKLLENENKFPTLVNLNIGGMQISVSKQTLMNVPNTFFSGLVRSAWKIPESGGSYFIDRSPTHIPRIMDYLRTGELNLDGLGMKDYSFLKVELDYYSMFDANIYLADQTLRWDVKRRPKNSVVANNGLQYDYSISDSPSAEVIGNHPVSEFTIQILSWHLSLLLICFSDGTYFDSISLNHKRGNSYCIEIDTGCIWMGEISASWSSCVPFTDRFRSHDYISMKRVKNEIYIYKNDINLGLAFGNVTDVELFPVVGHRGRSVSLLLVVA